MKKIILLFTFASFSCFSQSYIEGYIIDKTTNESLPYATIKVISQNSNYFSITNEDGKFEIRSKLPTDSLEVRFLGYETKKAPISFFTKNTKLYLAPNVNQLKEVFILANKNKNYAYNLLNRLIQKYRHKTLVTESKGFLTLTSSSRGIPLEIIEGFYNSKQSLSDGILDLKIKSGRFGQNKSFPFYSLNNTQVLKDFQFFKNSSQILPSYPGNMTHGEIKRKYIVKIDECSSCSNADLKISFVPKRFDGRLFIGSIIFNKEMLTIKKIELDINDPITDGLSSIIKNDVITPKQIKLIINFNPADYEKIQSLSLNFTMYYKSEEALQIIQSKSFLYFYDYNKSFKEPYFTNNIHFNNDYDKIIALQTTADFWNANYQFPKSFNEEKSMDFLKEYGNLINFENVIPTYDMEFTKPSVISWDKNKRLEWDNIKYEVTESANPNKHTNDYLKNNIKADKVYHSNADIVKHSRHFDNSKTLNFSYLMDQYADSNGKTQFTTRTIFDRNSSHYKNTRSKNMLVYLNLTFDIYEFYRQKLDGKINDNMTFNEVKKLCDEKFKEASITIKKMKKETNSGLNFQNLINWNNDIKTKLNIDNYSLISNQK
jgi:hypothetical protein